MFFEVESINVKQYEVIVAFKDVNDHVLDEITINETEAKYDDVSKKLSKSVTYKNSQLNVLKLATSIDFTASIAPATPLTIANDTLKFRSSAIIKLAL